MLNDVSIFGQLRTKMHWHQTRQTVLAQNVANADTPGFDARDLKPISKDSVSRMASLGTVRTDAAHFAGQFPGVGQFAKTGDGQTWEITPEGNGVVLEEQMMRLTENQMDYAVATSLYTRSLGLIRTAVAGS